MHGKSAKQILPPMNFGRVRFKQGRQTRRTVLDRALFLCPRHARAIVLAGNSLASEAMRVARCRCRKPKGRGWQFTSELFRRMARLRQLIALGWQIPS